MIDGITPATIRDNGDDLYIDNLDISSIVEAVFSNLISQNIHPEIEEVKTTLLSYFDQLTDASGALGIETEETITALVIDTYELEPED